MTDLAFDIVPLSAAELDIVDGAGAEAVFLPVARYRWRDRVGQ